MDFATNILQFYFSLFRLFFATLVQNSPILMVLFLNFNNLYVKYQNLLDSLKFPWISQRIFYNFQKINFEKSEKISKEVRN